MDRVQSIPAHLTRVPMQVDQIEDALASFDIEASLQHRDEPMHVSIQ